MSGHHRSAITIAVVAFAVLVFELTSTRLYAYIGSTHATSTALSIALLGLGGGAFVRLRAPQLTTPRRAILGLAISLLGWACAAIGGVGLTGLVVLSLLPFGYGGMLLADGYGARGQASARATYAIDVGAAAAACLIAPRLVGPVTPTEIVIVLGLACCGLAVVIIERSRRVWVAIALIAVAHVVLLVSGRLGALPDGPLDVLIASGDSEKAIVETATSPRNVVDSEWSPLGRLDVHRNIVDGEHRLGVFTDGMSPTYMVAAADSKATSFENRWGLLMSLPYRALRPVRVLVLGAGAGASVWLAKKYGASTVDAVEVNPAMPRLLARWRDYAGDVYHQSGVRLFTDDARRFLIDTTERYDVIELALALTGNVHAQPAGLEAHLYTVEAVELYLSRLTASGVIILIHSDPGNAYRQLLTVLEALAARGLARERALDGVVVLHDPRPGTAYRYMIVVSTAPIAVDVVDRLDIPPAELLWAPGDPPERARALLDRNQLGVTTDDDFAPVHDDRPYFFQNTNGLIATALAQPGRLWVMAGALLLLGAMIVAGSSTERTSAFVRPALAATGLGAGFLAVELALIQRFTLAAGGTLYAVSFVLFSLLAASASGALMVSGRVRRFERAVSWSCLAAALVIAATTIVVRDVAWIDAITSDAARHAVIAAIIMPLGLAIGCPFPLLLGHHGSSPARLARLWAINGAAAVAGGALAVLVLRVGGATDALWVAVACYLVTATIAPARMASVRA